jgi:prepilin-type N-terminal cleavage/methylation domain-containing protein
MRSDRRAGGHDDGFSLIELLVGIGLVAILVTLSAGALRTYWLTQGLVGSRDEVVSQLRASQEQVVSESHPLVFGARFQTGSSTWGLVEFDPGTNTCVELSRTLSTGVTPQSASFTSSAETTFCQANLVFAGGSVPVPDRATSAYVWFYARGTATAGSLTFTQPALPGKSVSLTVTPLTGRVEAS